MLVETCCAVQVVELIQQCWQQLPIDRPTMKEVCSQLEAILRTVAAAGRGKGKAVPAVPSQK